MQDSLPLPPGGIGRKPSWLRVSLGTAGDFPEVSRTLEDLRLSTVCREARCPNRTECWSARTATFLLLGGVCTRGCAFCAVPRASSGEPADPTEAERVAEAALRLGLRFAVLTSVTRDDLPDGGASIFSAAVRALRETARCRVEVLTPDYSGDALGAVLDAAPDVFAHNLETVRRFTPALRHPRFRYETSLEVLAEARRHSPGLLTKSSLLLGLGEEEEEVGEALRDLRAAGTDILVLGQYLRPTKHHAPVRRYLAPEEFDAWAARAREAGFRAVHAGPRVRTSYRAAETFARTVPHT